MARTRGARDIDIQWEEPEHIHRIRQLIRAAFASRSHLNHREVDIVDQLRRGQALVLSLVACHEEKIIGHIAASPVLIDGQAKSWLGLGPVSVAPEWQGRGIGSLLVERAVGEMASRGFAGCVVAGSPDFYGRLGFERHSHLAFEGAPAGFFMSQVLVGPAERGRVTYHEAFHLGSETLHDRDRTSEVE